METRFKKQQDAFKEAIRKSGKRPGEIICNGATLLMQHEVYRDDHKAEYIVLAVSKGAFAPFVTWRRIVGVSQLATGGFNTLDYTFSGSYHRDLEDATKDYWDHIAGVAGVEAQHDEEEEDGQGCGAQYVMGPGNDPYSTSCHLEAGHDGPHTAGCPFGTDREVSWEGGGSCAGDSLPYRNVTWKDVDNS